MSDTLRAHQQTPRLGEHLFARVCEWFASYRASHGSPGGAQPPERFDRTIKRIEQMASMKQSGPHGAIGPDEQACGAAVALLRRIARTYGAAVPEPSAAEPTSDRGVAIDWRLTSGDFVEFTVLPRGVYEWAVRDAKTETFKDGNEEATADELVDVVKSVVAHRHTVAA